MEQENIVLFEDAVKHRTTGGSEIVMQFENSDTVVIPIGADDWVCDLCNKPLKVLAENGEKITQLSLNGNQTLCMECWTRIFKEDNSLFDNIKHCSCCLNPKANLYAFREAENGFKSFMRFENEDQAEEFANTFTEITKQMVIFQRLETDKQEEE